MDEIIAGGFAGLAQTVVGYPLDTVKVLMVNKQKIEWGRRLYRGAWAPTVGAVVVNAQTFVTYNYFRSLKEAPLISSPFVSGLLTGIAISIVETPTELVKIRMQTNQRGKYGQVMRNIMGNPFQGFTATCWRNGIGVGLYFHAYEHIMEKYGGSSEARKYAASLFGGSVAGMACWAGAYPFDYMKTQIQAGEKLSLHSWSQMRRMFTGFTPCIVRAGLVNPFVFLTYECVKSKLGGEKKMFLKD